MKGEESKGFSADELEKMINDFIEFYQDPSGKSDIEAEQANVLNRNCLAISQQLLSLLKEK